MKRNTASFCEHVILFHSFYEMKAFSNNKNVKDCLTNFKYLLKNKYKTPKKCFS